MSSKLSGPSRRPPPAATTERFERAVAAHRAGRLAEAESGYRVVLRQAPQHLGCLQNLGAVCRAGHRHDEALGLYRQALRLAPNADDVRLNLGNLLEDMGRHAEAETAFREVLQRRPADTHALYGLAHVLLHQQCDDDAMGALERLLAASPEHRQGRNLLAAALGRSAASQARQGRAEAARDLYRRALDLAPGNPALHLGLGQVLNQLHAFADAVPWLRRATEMAPTAPPPRIALAFALLYSGAEAEAETMATEGAALDPSSATAQYVLARILALRGDGAGAEAALEKARALGLEPGGIGELEHLIHGRSEAATALATLRDKYDQTALYYESHVLAGLQNRTAGLLLELLDRHAAPGSRFAAGLELGCGPGATGETLRRRIDRLVGVDLSPAMVAQAGRRGVYDRLAAADLMTFLDEDAPTAEEKAGEEDAAVARERFALIFASDVLPHIAEFGPLMAAVAGRLQPGGLFLFSTEHSETADRMPLPEFRHRHSLRHVEQSALAAGLETVAHEVRQIRVERGGPVMGGLYLLRQPG